MGFLPKTFDFKYLYIVSVGFFGDQPAGFGPVSPAGLNLDAGTGGDCWVQPTLIGQATQQAGISTAGLPALAVQKNMASIVKHATASVESQGQTWTPNTLRLEPDLGLGLGEPLAQSALGDVRLGQGLGQGLSRGLEEG